MLGKNKNKNKIKNKNRGQSQHDFTTLPAINLQAVLTELLVFVDSKPLRIFRLNEHFCRAYPHFDSFVQRYNYNMKLESEGLHKLKWIWDKEINDFLIFSATTATIGRALYDFVCRVSADYSIIEQDRMSEFYSAYPDCKEIMRHMGSLTVADICKAVGYLECNFDSRIGCMISVTGYPQELAIDVEQLRSNYTEEAVGGGWERVAMVSVIVTIMSDLFTKGSVTCTNNHICLACTVCEYVDTSYPRALLQGGHISRDSIGVSKARSIFSLQCIRESV